MTGDISASGAVDAARSGVVRSWGMAVIEEPFVPIARDRSSIAPVTEIKSTWIGASLASLRRQGLFDRYIVHVPKHHQDAILLSVAGAWLPVEVAMAHYAACDAMGLSRQEMLDRGLAVSAATQSTILGAVARAAKGAGVTPWTVFEQYPRIWSSVFVGGAIGVVKLGPKEARVEAVSIPLARFEYFRTGMRGVLLDIGSRFSTRAYCLEIPRMCDASTMTFRYSWA